MAKALRIVGTIASVVAVVAAFIPGGQVIAGIAKAATIAKYAGAVAAVAGMASQLAMKKPRAPGVENAFRIDPNSGIQYIIGRTRAGGSVVHRRGYTEAAKNPYSSFVLDFSGGGPIDAIETVLLDGVAASFPGGAATGHYAGFMWFTSQLGACPEPSALAAPFAGFPDWGAASKMSGHAAGIWTLKFDKKGEKYGNGEPDFGIVARGVKVYDPRLDSTYPGGVGACRLGVENTYVYSATPALHALTWLFGRWQNGKKAMGAGVPAAFLNIPAYVESANVQEANNWAVGAVLDGSGNKWNNARLMLEAGAAQPLNLGGLISVTWEAPRVSLATVRKGDLMGLPVIPRMRTWRDRINTVIPKFRSEDHNWQMIDADPIADAAAVTADGGPRTRQVEYTTVQDKDQAAQLAAYDIAAGREVDGIVLPLKPAWWGYHPGDCITLDLPEDGITGLKLVIENRDLDVATGGVTFSCRTETDAKHGWALAQTGTVPPALTPTDPAVTDGILYGNGVDYVTGAVGSGDIDLGELP